MKSIHTALAQRGITRSDDGRWFGGVCAGLAKLFGVDVMPVRILVLIALVVLPGSPLVLYPIAWILMPSENALPSGGSFSAGPISNGPQDTIR
ncbi:MAG: PspC domain-containing protein [Mobilicoccus sp.]|nr:PspC domain-containing protein [Mobilicoccus sp.]